MLTRSCAFATDRLEIAEWHSFPESTYDHQQLPADVAGMLTEDVTKSLPPPWQGKYSLKRAASWVAERDLEGTTLLVLDRQAAQPIGLIILFESQPSIESTQIELRLGYLLSQSFWGRGYASEMLHGLLLWCMEQAPISSLVGGVSRDNPASRRVLEKLGFLLAHSSPDEDFFKIVLRER